jgi:hypothetical protein
MSMETDDDISKKHTDKYAVLVKDEGTRTDWLKALIVEKCLLQHFSLQFA